MRKLQAEHQKTNLGVRPTSFYGGFFESAMFDMHVEKDSPELVQFLSKWSPCPYTMVDLAKGLKLSSFTYEYYESGHYAAGEYEYKDGELKHWDVGHILEGLEKHPERRTYIHDGEEWECDDDLVEHLVELEKKKVAQATTV
jgi:hypothetical protein